MPAQLIKTSMISQRPHRMFFPQYTQDEFEKRLTYYLNNPVLIQDAFPELDNNQREFIKTGITPEEWDKFIGNDDQ